MMIQELDVVKLKNGQTGTVLEVFIGPAFFIETDSDNMTDWPIVTLDEIEEVIYVHNASR